MTSKKKIYITLFSDFFYISGGVESWMRDFIVELDRKIEEDNIQIEIKIFALCKEKQIYKEKIPHNLKNIEIICASNSESKYLIKIIRFWKIFLTHFLKDFLISKVKVIISIGTSVEGTFGFFLNKILPVKKIIWARTYYERFVNTITNNEFIKKFLLYVEYLNVITSDLILTNGIDTSSLYSNKYKSSSNKIITIENGINLKKFSSLNPVIKKPSIIVISYIGRLSIEKGILDFLKAIEFFNQKYFYLNKNIRFEIVGDGIYRKDVIEHTLRYGNVFYMGVIDNSKIQDYYKNIHAGVFLTYENNLFGGSGISISLIECMASGRIPIAWNNSVYSQILEDNYNAILVEEKNYEKLSEKFFELLADFEKYFMISFNAKEVSKQYSVENQVEKFLKIIQKFI